MNLTELLAAAKRPSAPQPTAPLSARLGLTGVAIPPAEVMGINNKAPVTSTADLERIAAIPRRPVLNDNELDELVAKWNTMLMVRGGNPSCACEDRFGHLAVPCINSFNPQQAWSLEEFARYGGLLGKLPVGSGKTGLDVMLAMVRQDVKVVLLLLQSGLIPQFLRDDYPQWAAHFQVPNLDARYSEVYTPGRPVLHVYSYTDLSLPKHTTLLNELNPDLIISDESENLANTKSSRTMRFIKHFQTHPDCKFVALSGSMDGRGIGSYAHHSALALRGSSPLPLDPDTVKKWGKALDPAPPNGVVTPIGKLAVLCNPGEDAVTGVGRRVRETGGVVTAERSSTGVPLIITTRKPPPIPDVLQQAMEITRTGERPDGEEADSAFQKAAWLKQLACGFYYFFRFPRGEPEELIGKWFERRKVWHKEIRHYLDVNNPPPEHLDSPKLLRNAAKRFYSNYRGPLPTWDSVFYRPWIEVEDKVKPVQAVKWIDDHIQNDAVAWTNERRAAGEGGIIWCEFGEIGERVAKAIGMPYYNGGPINKGLLRAERGDRVIVCSIKAYHRGENLQRFNRNLVVSNPADGGTWEQMLGRTHRYGQTKPVYVEVYRHTPELRGALEKALERSEWTAKMNKCDQKLVIAKKDWVRE